MSGFSATLRTWSGLIVGATAWACATQAAQVLPYLDCADNGARAGAVICAAVAAAAGGAVASWRAGRGDQASLFAARISALAGLIFAFALTLQGAASLLTPACAR
ncbi:hypothetical protein [Methylopila sp. Yamaguchi]|uniref:hypothetical protein n=1 Tax=Methylopila sp. Yamaguchi TaxID=1437817 RepID=UPI000CB16A07|nr:hypothetical protein [Methylopila sp. Yamaguchi]GBD50175.1 hypothetical protein METY_3388 [Methylopila sp. Yamaguchi]